MLLVGAQRGALTHAYEHDPGTLQNQACAVCVTASQLGFGCIDTLADTPIEYCRSCHAIERVAIFESFHRLAARQRGPPNPL